MKNIRAAVALFLVAVFLAGTAFATSSSVNPNVPAQNSPLSSSVLRSNFAAANSDLNTIFGVNTLSSNQILGTINAGNAGPINVPSCASGALSWTPGTGLGCNSLSGLVSPITQSLVFTGAFALNLNSAALPTKQTGTVLQLGNADTIASRIENDAYGAPAYFTGVRSDGTNAAPTTLQSGDEIAGFNAWGYNGSSVVGPRASMRAFAAQNWTGSAQGTYIDIVTALNGTTTPAGVCRFENDGGIDCPSTVTGGDQGAGKINAAGLFVNGVAVSVGASSLSALTAALGANSIENGANAQVWNFDALTTQTALQITGTGVTTGELFNSSVANAASTGYAGYFSNTGTAASYALYSTDATTGAGYGHYSSVTGASNSGYGVYAANTGASNTGYGIYGSNTSTTGYGVYSNGTLGVAGAISVTTTVATAPTNGLYSSAANTLRLVTSGSPALFLSTTQTVGIGTVTPTANLHIVSPTSTSAVFKLDGGNGGASFQLNATTSSGHSWQFNSLDSNNGGANFAGGFSFYDGTANKDPVTFSGTGLVELVSGGVFGFSSAASFPDLTQTDTALSRSSAGVVAVGSNSTSGNTTGKIKASGLISAGTKFTASGCSNGTTVGGATAGKFTLGANTCTVVVTMGDSATAANGWNCSANDLTAPTIGIGMTASTATTATLNVPSGAGSTDVVSFSCIGF